MYNQLSSNIKNSLIYQCTVNNFILSNSLLQPYFTTDKNVFYTIATTTIT